MDFDYWKRRLMDRLSMTETDWANYKGSCPPECRMPTAEELKSMVRETYRTSWGWLEGWNED